MKLGPLMALLVLTSCIDVGEERVAQDLKVGKASVGDAKVEVAGGFASVRTFANRELTLWGQAPEFSLELDPGSQTGEWTLQFWNVMSDARLMVGDQLLEPIEQRIPTRQTYQIQISQPTQLRWVAPDTANPDPWTFLAFADVQERLEDVQEIYARMADFEEARFCLISGDLTRRGGYDENIRFQKAMESLPIPCFATLGNHDISGDDHNFHKFYGRGNQSWVFRDVRFTFVDSASATVASQAFDWLDGWLADGKDQAHLVMMHIPPLDPNGFRNGAFASRAEANRVINRMNQYDVDIAIYGHVHTYYAFTDGEVPSYVTGGGGAIPMRFDGIGRHFLVLRVDPSKQEFLTAVERVFPE